MARDAHACEVAVVVAAALFDRDAVIHLHACRYTSWCSSEAVDAERVAQQDAPTDYRPCMAAAVT
jgi:hypothetical protein